MKITRWTLMFLLLLGLVVVPALAQDDVPESVCLITDIGRINDKTFNQSAYEGMVRAADDFDLESRFIETQAQVDYDTNLATCINEGFDIVITVGFALADGTYAAALENPDIYFIGIDAFFPEPLPNLVGLQFREDQAGFLAGAIAASLTKTGTIAGIYGVDYPALRRFRNGYEQGAHYTDPDVRVLGVYIPDFQAPELGASAAIQFIGEGADVIFGAAGPTGSGGIIQAAQEGVWVIGVDQDEYFTSFDGGETPGAQYIVSSAIKRVDNGVYDMVQAAVEGTGYPEDSMYVLSIENEGIGFAPAHDSGLPDEITEYATMVLEGLHEGTIDTGVDFMSGDLLSEIEAEATPEPSGD